MEILLGLAVYTLLVGHLWHVARTDYQYAKRGIPSPRMEAKYGSKKAAQQATAGYGFLGHLREAWRDYWPRRTEALRAARDSGEFKFSQQVAAAKRAIRQSPQTARNGWSKLIDPVEPKGTDPDDSDDDESQPETPTDTPVGTIRTTDTGREVWDGTRWQPARKPSPRPRETNNTADDLRCHGCGQPFDDHIVATLPGDSEPSPICPRQPAPNRNAEGDTMTQFIPGPGNPGGEVANYETAVATLEVLIEAQRAELEAATAACRSIEQTKASIDMMQQTYRQSSTIAPNCHDQLAALNLDGTTLAHTGAIADALPAGRIDMMYDQLEEIETLAREREQAAEIALGESEAALKHIQETYGDAHATVAGNLGGDSRFLDSGGMASGAAASTPAGDGGPTPTADDRSAAPRDAADDTPSVSKNPPGVHGNGIYSPGNVNFKGTLNTGKSTMPEMKIPAGTPVAVNNGIKAGGDVNLTNATVGSNVKVPSGN